MLSFGHETEIPHRIFPYGHQPRCLRIADSQPRAHSSAADLRCVSNIAASINPGLKLNIAASIDPGLQLNGQFRFSQRIG